MLPPHTNSSVFYTCGSGCTNIALKAAPLQSSTGYEFRQVPYTFYPYKTSYGIEDSTFYGRGARFYSRAYNLPFPVCFYDSIYTAFVLDQSGLVTFDISNANCRDFSNWFAPIPTSCQITGYCNNPEFCYYPRACIMGVSTLLDGFLSNNIPGYYTVSPPDRKIEYRVEGIAPLRKVIFSYYKLGTYGDTACSRMEKFATFQMAVQENTGLVEINIENFSCPATGFGEGQAVCGIQNWARDKGTAAPGKNATVWTAFHESYQFVPSGSGNRYINSKLLSLSGAIIATADTATDTATGFINISFNNICPIADTTQYLVQSNYGGCQPFSVHDTITLIRNNSITATVTSFSNCISNGTITVQATGDVFQYQLDAGTLQNSNTFSNVLPGNHAVQLAGTNTSCRSLFPVNVATPVLQLHTRPDTAICKGDALLLGTLTDATNFTWQPAQGLSNAAIASPLAMPDTSTRYTIRASAGNCTGTDSVLITVNPKPIVYAGNDITVVTGDDAQLAASVNNWISLLWSPATGLSNTSILRPVLLQPQQTNTYRLTATNSDGCSNYDDVLVTVLPNCVDVKNAFTPNGDGIHDSWIIYNQFDCLKNIVAKVYNRYGSKVYENKNYRNEWKGTYNNKPLPDGTYYYVLTIQLITGKTYEVTGNLTILR